ncbi:hypothetical protein CBER1_10965 [Cercospora berteroae]|uniref:LysM domain-containing protein n=1 Tax=Cercospora berteroae TaxID=357750 RepID=A0A2S6CME1_9PEZI|nr:hypothetical protein CBER1_10965 [Cercospora berteroae]
MESEAQTLHDSLDQHPNGKICWAVYRCSYEDDAQWARFVQRLTDWALCRLKDEEDGELLRDHFEWNVKEDNAKFDRASMSDIRRDFNEWVTETDSYRKLTMSQCCIYADAETIESVLGGPDPNSGAPYIDSDTTAWVKVLDGCHKDEVYQFSEEEISDGEERARQNSGDEGYEAIDGCRAQNVGWMKVAACHLIPRAYYCLMKCGCFAGETRKPTSFARSCGTSGEKAYREEVMSTTDGQCHNCTFSFIEAELESPFWYPEDHATTYEKLKIFCNKPDLPALPLPPYRVGPTIGIDHAKPCNATYTALPGDTCFSIAEATDTDSLALARLNDITWLDSIAGRKLCIPRRRKTYVVQEVDIGKTTCVNMMGARSEEGSSVSYRSLHPWNPSVDSRCSNLRIGQVIWISRPERGFSAYKYRMKLRNEQKKGSEVAGAVDCRFSVRSVGKLSCFWVAERHQMRVEYLMKLNPGIECASGIESNRTVCIKAEVDEAVPIGEPSFEKIGLSEEAGNHQQVVLSEGSMPKSKYLSEEE